MKKTTLFTAFCILFAISGTVQAASYQDTDYYYNSTGTLGLRLAFDGSPDPVGGVSSAQSLLASTVGANSATPVGQFDIRNDDGGGHAGDAFGFTPGVDPDITSIKVEFAIASSDEEFEETIFVVQGSTDSFVDDVFNTTVVYAGSTVNAIAQLNNFGNVIYDVYVVLPKNAPADAEGSIRLNWARLMATNDQVPEGGFSLSLLGLALLGLVGVKRRFAK